MGAVINGPMIDDLMEAIEFQQRMWDYDGDIVYPTRSNKIKRTEKNKAKVKAKRKFVRKQKSKMRRKRK